MIVGMATLTAVTLSPIDKVPRNSVIAIHHLCIPSELGEAIAAVSIGAPLSENFF
jgi:hypothetical protein